MMIIQVNTILPSKTPYIFRPEIQILLIFSLSKNNFFGALFAAAIRFFSRGWNRVRNWKCSYLLIKISKTSFEVIFGGSISWSIYGWDSIFCTPHFLRLKFFILLFFSLIKNKLCGTQFSAEIWFFFAAEIGGKH